MLTWRRGLVAQQVESYPTLLNMKTLQNHLIQYVGFQALLCRVFCYIVLHITDPPAAFWISYIGACPEARPSEQPHLPCLAALTSPAKRSPRLVPPDHCIWQTGYWGKAFQLVLVGCKPLQSVLQGRCEAFPHHVTRWQASDGPNSSQGWSGCTTAARLPSGPQQGWGTGVSLLLVGERDAKVVQKGTTLRLCVTPTMSNHF